MRIKHIAERLANTLLGRVRLEIRKKSESERLTLRGTLAQATSLGFKPATVIDVGADIGTYELYEPFAGTKLLLIEPLVENEPSLRRVVARYPGAEYVIAAATGKKGEVTINVHPDFNGSSLYLEREDSDVNGVPRTIPAITLDDLCKAHGLRGPYLLKVDVQGAELDVLAGASEILEDTEYVILEVSLFQTFVGGPQLYDVVAFMKERGFVTYDIFGNNYRPLDGAMCQIDMAFVKEKSPFRRVHAFATKEQRAALNTHAVRGRHAA